MSKFDIRICSCGRIHAIPKETEDKVIFSGEENNKDIALVCGKCGRITLIGADCVPNWYKEADTDPDMAYDCYSFPYTPKDNIGTLTSESFDKPTEIFYSVGYPVPMMTGEYATSYSFGSFHDMIYPDFMEIERYDTTMKDVKSFIENFRKNRTTVNMDRFIHETPDEVLDSISGYFIDAFDWTNTKYKKF